MVLEIEDSFKRQPGRLVAVLAGAFLLIAGVVFIGKRENGVLCGQVLLLGTIILTVGAMAPYIESLRISLRDGGEVKMRSATDLTSEIAEQGPGVVGTELEREGGTQEETQLESDAMARWTVAEAALLTLTNPRVGELAGSRVHVYLFDEATQLLVPNLETQDQRTESWEPGVGVTGMAYSRREFVLAVGDELTADRFGLNADQLERYSTLTAVASTPIILRSGNVVGVISTSTSDQDSGIATDGGRDELLAVAAAIALILEEILDWYQS